jgi:hypothetical protein
MCIGITYFNNNGLSQHKLAETRNNMQLYTSIFIRLTKAQPAGFKSFEKPTMSTHSCPMYGHGMVVTLWYHVVVWCPTTRCRSDAFRSNLTNMAANKLCLFWRKPTLNVYKTGKWSLFFHLHYFWERFSIYSIIFCIGFLNFRRCESTSTVKTEEIPKQSWKFLVRDTF